MHLNNKLLIPNTTYYTNEFNEFVSDETRLNDMRQTTPHQKILAVWLAFARWDSQWERKKQTTIDGYFNLAAWLWELHSSSKCTITRASLTLSSLLNDITIFSVNPLSFRFVCLFVCRCVHEFKSSCLSFLFASFLFVIFYLFRELYRRRHSYKNWYHVHHITDSHSPYLNPLIFRHRCENCAMRSLKESFIALLIADYCYGLLHSIATATAAAATIFVEYVVNIAVMFARTRSTLCSFICSFGGSLSLVRRIVQSELCFSLCYRDDSYTSRLFIYIYIL